MEDPGGSNTDLVSRARVRESNPKRKIFDWISEPRPQNITPFQQFIIDIDWEKSPLGPMRSWPPLLRHMVLLVVQDPSPAVVCWGDEATIVYNESYTQLIGSKHPNLQGQDPKIELAEIWDHFEALLARQRETAETAVETNALLLLHRHGFLEETFFSWKFVPIIGEDGWVVGSHATVIEVTREVVSDRRLQVVQGVSMQLSGAKSIKDLWKRILSGVNDAEYDIPLAVLYSVADSAMASRAFPKPPLPNGSAHHTSLPVCLLEGAIGIPSGHHIAPETIDLNNNHDTCVANALLRAMEDRNPVLVPVSEAVMEEFKGIKWRGHAVPPTQLVTCPIIPFDSDNVLGFLVLALNPHRPYDEDYRSFLHLLTQQVTQPQLSAVILREEVERRQRLAREEALDRARLTRELSESEGKFSRFASRAPVGLAILSPEGTALSVNVLWGDLTNLEVGMTSVAWSDVLSEGQLEPVMEAWDRLLSERKPITMQTRMKRQWRVPDQDPDGDVEWTETHILLAMYPDTDENGEVVSVMSCITDVSELKWNETQLRRRMDQAIEMKKQQERFIDMTSHEMRNPLSALIGCADEIIASLTDYRSLILPQSGSATPMSRTQSRSVSASNSSSSLKNLIALNSVSTLPPTAPSTMPIQRTIPLSPPLPVSLPPASTTSPTSNPSQEAKARHLIDEAIEAADTIIYCAMHQKRIIDDILTLSRLDSNLLLVSPEPCQPIPLIRSALKMFEAELKRAETALTFTEDRSLNDLGVAWTLLDPSRVLQVLINLMTNAVKFTRTEARREITVSMAASLTRPSERNELGVQYVARSNTSVDQTVRDEWGDGEVIYISITVTDTGRGLTEDEIKNLFRLFAQASPKTHQTYGGSGLGLFISRQLVNMQGGEIGVCSKAGEGSTFTFYVKTRRTAVEELEVVDVNGAADEKKGDAARVKLARSKSMQGQAAGTKNFELLVREDALREACAVEISALQNGVKMPNLQPEEAIPMSPVVLISTEKEAEKKKFHILVVEDNLVNQKVVTKSLQKNGHIVNVANHGEEALEFIRGSEFWASDSSPDTRPEVCSSDDVRTDGMVNGHAKDETIGHGSENSNGVVEKEKLNVVLMDLEMPIMDGLTCVRKIRELQNEGKIVGHIPVIAVTANARKDQIMTSIDAGMDDVTTKPYRMTDMLRQIEKLVARQT